MVSHPETGSDSPIGSDRDRGRDIATQINSIIYIHIKTTPNSSCNLYSTQIIFHYISFFKTFHELIPKQF